MVEISLLPAASVCTDPSVGKYELRRADTGYGVELLFFCLSARRYDPLFRLWRGEALPGDAAAAEALFRARLKLAATDGWRFVGKDGRVVAQRDRRE